MPSSITSLDETIWKLPPLILHPFNERVPPSTLLENSKAALILSGLIPGDGADPEELRRRLLSGRYAEVRMLFFLGKDVLRWIDQCLEWAEREPELCRLEIRRQSFAGLLTGNPPENVKQKLTRWGVADYSAIFSRAIGLNTLFTQPPAFDVMAEEFLRSYHRYADVLYQCYLELEPHRLIVSRNFQFELYASGEYSRLLESEWGSN
ncbi:MAG TPA: hypothetical protein VGS58_19980 [Candidatus Sulfopaludibacter sp.]|nr:hypothetical protein [Candidatus Sulfopaludibacter sp.]